VVLWLRANFWLGEGVSIRTEEVYMRYRDTCVQTKCAEPISPSCLSKCVRIAFPAVTITKLNARGVAKRYVGLRPRPGAFSMPDTRPTGESRAETSTRPQSFTCPNILPCFVGLPSHLVSSSVEFSRLYLDYWQHLYDIISQWKGPVQQTVAFKEFWKHTPQFLPLSVDAPFRSCCVEADRLVLQHLLDLLMSNPFDLRGDAFVSWLRRVAHMLGSMLHRGLLHCGLESKFVLERIESMHIFIEEVLKRACTLESGNSQNA